MMNIVIGKSITGEFIIGKLDSKKDDFGKDIPVLTEVYSLALLPDTSHQQKQIKPIIYPLMFPFDDKPIKEITMDKIFTIVDAPEDICKTYMEMITEINIVFPNTKIIQ